MQQTNISIRMDESLKKKFDYVCNELGLTVSAAITVFAKQVCREGKIPFEITLGKDYEEKINMDMPISYHAIVFSEHGEFEQIEKEFDDLGKAFEFINSNSNDLSFEFCVSYGIRIVNLDHHTHFIMYGDEGLQYIRDGVYKKIECDELCFEDENLMYRMIEGYIKALIG